MSNIAKLPVPPANPVNRRVGRNVRYIMDVRGMNQTELAVKLGLTDSQVSRRIGGKVEWTPDDLRAAADILRVRIGLLFDLELPHPDSNGEPIGFKPEGQLISVDFARRRAVLP